MIYAGLELYNYMVNSFGEPWGKWHELKEHFLAAEKKKAVSSEASEHARVAVESMAMAEKKWGRMKGESVLRVRAPSRPVGWWEGKTESHDVAFSDTFFVK